MRLPIHRESRRGKSINLALSERGLSALRGTGLSLEKTILEASVPMTARMVHIGKNGTQMSQAYDVNGQVNFLLSLCTKHLPLTCTIAHQCCRQSQIE